MSGINFERLISLKKNAENHINLIPEFLHKKHPKHKRKITSKYIEEIFTPVTIIGKRAEESRAIKKDFQKEMIHHLVKAVISNIGNKNISLHTSDLFFSTNSLAKKEFQKTYNEKLLSIINYNLSNRAPTNRRYTKKIISFIYQPDVIKQVLLNQNNCVFNQFESIIKSINNMFYKKVSKQLPEIEDTALVSKKKQNKLVKFESIFSETLCILLKTSGVSNDKKSHVLQQLLLNSIQERKLLSRLKIKHKFYDFFKALASEQQMEIMENLPLNISENDKEKYQRVDIPAQPGSGKTRSVVLSIVSSLQGKPKYQAMIIPKLGHELAVWKTEFEQIPYNLRPTIIGRVPGDDFIIKGSEENGLVTIVASTVISQSLPVPNKWAKEIQDKLQNKIVAPSILFEQEWGSPLKLNKEKIQLGWTQIFVMLEALNESLNESLNKINPEATMKIINGDIELKHYFDKLEIITNDIFAKPKDKDDRKNFIIQYNKYLSKNVGSELLNALESKDLQEILSTKHSPEIEKHIKLLDYLIYKVKCLKNLSNAKENIPHPKDIKIIVMDEEQIITPQLTPYFILPNYYIYISANDNFIGTNKSYKSEKSNTFDFSRLQKNNSIKIKKLPNPYQLNIGSNFEIKIKTKHTSLLENISLLFMSQMNLNLNEIKKTLASGEKTYTPIEIKNKPDYFSTKNLPPNSQLNYIKNEIKRSTLEHQKLDNDKSLNDIIDTASDISKKLLKKDKLQIITKLRKLISYFNIHDEKAIKHNIMFILHQINDNDKKVYRKQITAYLSQINETKDTQDTQDTSSSSRPSKRCKTEKEMKNFKRKLITLNNTIKITGDNFFINLIKIFLRFEYYSCIVNEIPDTQKYSSHSHAMTPILAEAFEENRQIKVFVPPNNRFPIGKIKEEIPSKDFMSLSLSLLCSHKKHPVLHNKYLRSHILKYLFKTINQDIRNNLKEEKPRTSTRNQVADFHTKKIEFIEIDHSTASVWTGLNVHQNPLTMIIDINNKLNANNLFQVIGRATRPQSKVKLVFTLCSSSDIYKSELEDIHKLFSQINDKRQIYNNFDEAILQKIASCGDLPMYEKTLSASMGSYFASLEPDDQKQKQDLENIEKITPVLQFLDTHEKLRHQCTRENTETLNKLI